MLKKLLSKQYLVLMLSGFIFGFVGLAVVEACTPEVTPICEENCPTETPSPTPECFEDECNEPTVTPEPTVEPTNAPPCNECGGDGLSDHRSDGRSSTPQVLGASTVPSGPPATGRGEELVPCSVPNTCGSK